jgi:hypothetical protein
MIVSCKSESLTEVSPSAKLKGRLFSLLHRFMSKARGHSLLRSKSHKYSRNEIRFEGRTINQSNAVPSIRTPIFVFTSIPSNFIFPAWTKNHSVLSRNVEQHHVPQSSHAAPSSKPAAVLCLGNFPVPLGSSCACSSALSGPLLGRTSLPLGVGIHPSGERTSVARRLPCDNIFRGEVLLEQI